MPSIRAVQDAALDRAILNGSDPRAYLELAGRLDRVGAEADPLFVTVLLQTIRTVNGPAVPGSPSVDGSNALRTGAALLVLREDVSVGRAAQLSGVPPARIQSTVEDRTVEDGT